MPSLFALFMGVLSLSIMIVPSSGQAEECPRGYTPQVAPRHTRPAGLMTEPQVLMYCASETQRIRMVYLPMIGDETDYLRLMKGFIDFDTAFISDLSRSLPLNAESRSADGMMVALARKQVGGLLAFIVPTGLVRFEWEVLAYNKKDYAWRNAFAEKWVAKLRQTPPPLPEPTPAMKQLANTECLPGYHVPPNYHPDWAILDAVISPKLEMKEFCSAGTTNEGANLYYSGVEELSGEDWAEVLADAEEDGPAKLATAPLIPEPKSTYITANRRSVFHTNVEGHKISLLFTRRIKEGGVLGGFLSTRGDGVKGMQAMIARWNKLYPELEDWKPPVKRTKTKVKTKPQEMPIGWIVVGGLLTFVLVLSSLIVSTRRARKNRVNF